MRKPTRKECIEHACHGCEGFYTDGKVDCENITCPLYTYMPYKKLTPDWECFNYSPRRRGKILISSLKAKVTEEQREKGKILSETRGKDED